MAASSPSLSSNGPASSSAAAVFANPPKTLRGLNKPKCIQCGNVARSRCPYQSCKGCCSRAENPCPIHVLKANTSFPEKTPTQSAPSSDQKSAEASSAGSSHRISSLRQLSSNFAQFNNLSVQLRPKKPLTRKDAVAINEWRFSKLKEYKDRNIEVENESFERYLQNVSLLEEVFSSASSLEANSSLASEQDDAGMIIPKLKLMLRSNYKRTEQYRERIRQIVDQGLNKLKKCETNDRDEDEGDQEKLDKRAKRAKWEERTSALSDLVDKLNKARNEEDLKPCLEIKSQLFNKLAVSSRKETEDVEVSSDSSTKKELVSNKELDSSSPEFIRAAEIDDETLKRIDEHFSSLEQIEDL